MNVDIELDIFLERLQEIRLTVYNTTNCHELATCKRQLQEILENTFDTFINSGRQQNKFDWSLIRLFYKHCKELLCYLWTLRIFCSFILKLFYMFDCEDEQLIMKIVYMYHEVLNIYDTMSLCNNCIRLNYPKHYRSEEAQGARLILKNVNNVETYKFTNRDLYSEITIDAIWEGDYMHLKFLMKYGLSYFREGGFNTAKKQLGQMYNMYHYLRNLRENVLGDRQRFITSSLRLLFQDEENRNFQRTTLITKIVRICLFKSVGDTCYPDYAKCLKLYALTLKEPAISVEDVKKFLNLIFHDDRTFINETFAIFKEVFVESPIAPSPRSLKHLCRCSVRDCIQKIPSLPAVISTMLIPMEVKDYLLFLSD